MARYIDADRFSERLESALEDLGEPNISTQPIAFGGANAIKSVLDVAKNQPTADVVEVKHGHFVRNERNIPKMKKFHEKGFALSMNEKSIFYTCSECREWISLSQKYCSECGAKMDGERRTE